MSAPNINIWGLVRTAGNVATIAKGVSRRLATKAAPAAYPQSPPPLPASGAAGPVLRFGAIRGEVIGWRVFTKAFTQSGGGGGYIYQGTGNIAPVWTQTTHVRRAEFWLREWNTRQENHYWLEGYNEVVLRDGQDVTLVFSDRTLVWVRNHSANQAHALVHHERLLPPLSAGTGSLGRTVAALGAAGGGFWVCCFALGVISEIIGLPSSSLLLALIALLSLAAGLVVGVALHRRLARSDRHITRASAEYRARAEADLRAAYQRYLA